MFALRINIKDIINDARREQFFEELKNTDYSFEIKIWHNGDIKQKIIDKLNEEVGEKIREKIEYSFTTQNKKSQYAWFDINGPNSKNRFEYSGNLIEGVKTFVTMLNIVCKTDKRIKFDKNEYNKKNG